MPDSTKEKHISGPYPLYSELARTPRKPISVKLVKGGYLLTFEGGDTRILPRMTTALGVLAKPALIWWSANAEREYCLDKAVETMEQLAMVPTEAEVFRQNMLKNLGDKKAHQLKLKKGGDIGSEVHALVQWRLHNVLGQQEDESEASQQAQLAYMAWDEWREAIDLQPTHVETAIGSESLGVGGTLDCAAWFNYQNTRRHAIFDWKSSNPSKTAPDGIYPESLIQVVGYREIMIEMGEADKDSMAGVVRLPKTLEDPLFKSKRITDYRILTPKECEHIALGLRSIIATYNFMEGLK